MMIRQIKIFRPENIKDLEPFLAQYTTAELLTAEHFAVEKRADNILSIGDKKTLKAVARPGERPYQIPIIYAVYETEGNAPSGETAKTKSFSITDSIVEINKFLATHAVEKIFILPMLETSGPLDNYYAGEYGPVPDRRPANVISHRLVVVYKE